MLNLYLEQVEQNSRAKLPLKGALWSTAAGFTRNLKGAYPSYAKLLFDTSVDLVAAMVGKYYYRLLGHSSQKGTEQKILGQNPDL